MPILGKPPVVLPERCGSVEQTDWSADRTEQAGLGITHDSGPTGSYFLPQIVGPGATLFDFENDGRLAVYLLQNGGPKGQKNRPYRQQPDGTFCDVSAGHCMGVAVGDGNNDGRPDVLVTMYGGVGLLLNNGNGTFTDVTRGGAGQSSGPARGREEAVAHLRQALTFTPRAPDPCCTVLPGSAKGVALHEPGPFSPGGPPVCAGRGTWGRPAAPA